MRQYTSISHTEFFYSTHILRLGNVLRKCLLAQSREGSEKK
jgi:hypothetical protein